MKSKNQKHFKKEDVKNIVRNGNLEEKSEYENRGYHEGFGISVIRGRRQKPL